MTEERKPAPLLNGPQTVKSIRDTGYKSTDYAIAELIDNAIEAKARNVLVVVVERTATGLRRATTRAEEIWVVDDGEGMDEQLANTALSFGGSHRYDSRKGIGRFGMGLPQASVSQCKRTDLWTWQESSLDNACHTFLDLKTIEESSNPALTVPWPSAPGEIGYETIPAWVKACAYAELDSQIIAGQEVVPSGTVVRWSDLDRTRWVRSSTIRKHAEYLLGRIYRRFLRPGHSNHRAIKFAIVAAEDLEKGKGPQFDLIIPNDPLYLSVPSGDNLEFWERQNPEWVEGGQEPTTVRVTDEPLFKKYSEVDLLVNDVKGTQHSVRIVASMAHPEARPANIRNVGSATHQGEHTRRNRGISVMRADREITLETTYVYEATDRWWAVEVSFDAALDEIFGVTNNKQEVPYFTSALKLAMQDGSAASLEDAIESGEFTEDHPIAELYDVAVKIVHIIRTMRDNQKETRKRRRDNQKKASGGKTAVPAVSTAVKKERSTKEPTPGEKEYTKTAALEGQDAARERTIQQVREKLAGQLSVDEVNAVVEQYREGMTVQVIEQTQDNAPSFFWPEEFGNLEVLNINISHAASKFLLDPLRLSDSQIEALDEVAAKKALGQGVDALVYLLLAWSWMELEHKQTNEYEVIQRIRDNWGRRLREYVGSDPFRASREDVADLLGLDDEDHDEDGE
jgi:hypothetical protein